MVNYQEPKESQKKYLEIYNKIIGVIMYRLKRPNLSLRDRIENYVQLFSEVKFS